MTRIGVFGARSRSSGLCGALSNRGAIRVSKGDLAGASPISTFHHAGSEIAGRLHQSCFTYAMMHEYEKAIADRRRRSSWSRGIREIIGCTAPSASRLQQLNASESPSPNTTRPFGLPREDERVGSTTSSGATPGGPARPDPSADRRPGGRPTRHQSGSHLHARAGRTALIPRHSALIG